MTLSQSGPQQQPLDDIEEQILILNKYAHLLHPANDFYLLDLHLAIMDLTADQLSDFVSFKFPFSMSQLLKDCRWHECGSDQKYLPTKYKDLESFVTIGMSPKKRMEVRQLAGLVHDVATARNTNVTTIVELGSGQGYLSNTLAFQFGLDCLAFDSCQIQTDGATRNAKLIRKSKQGKLYSGILSHINTKVCTGDKLEDLLAKSSLNHNNSAGAKGGRYLLCGLHACGDLSPSMLDIFIQSEAKAVVNVGCCYNLVSRFPMSEYLRSRNYILTKAQLNTGSQNVKAWSKMTIKENMIVFERMHWRLMLQVILSRIYGVQPGECKFRVGKLNKEAFSTTFSNYCLAALGKLGLEVNSAVVHEIDNVFNEYDKFLNRVVVYWTQRSMMAQVIEELIINDRKLYLNEHGVHNVQAVPVFTKMDSPRNIALVAIKP